MILGFGCIWLAPNFAMIIIGRLLAGLSCGLISGTAPTYVVEISTESIRGMLGAGFQVRHDYRLSLLRLQELIGLIFQLCVTIGILFSFVFGAIISWKWLSFICIFPALAMSVLMLLMPETPIWLMTKAKGDHSTGSEAEKALKKLRAATNDNDSELQEMAEGVAKSSKSKSFSMEESKNPLFYKPLILSVLLMFFQQFSGINAVMFNSEAILKEAGSTLTPSIATICIGVAQVIATLIGTQLIDRLGRKMLLIGSGAGHAVSLGLLGIYNVFELKDSVGWLPVVCLVVFIISFSLGWGPIPWLMVGEITPMKFRSMVSAVSTAVNWGSAFVITHNFAALQEATSKEFAFFTFTFFSVVSIPFVVMFLPETKGKSFDEILRHFAKDVPKSEENDDKIEMKGLNEEK